MTNRTVFYKLGMVAAFAVAFQACKPKLVITGNNEVVSKPYSLFIGYENGQIDLTNDGYAAQVGIKGADGSSVLAIGTSGNNVLYIQGNIHVMEGVGNSHNPIGITNNHPDSKNSNTWGCDSRFLDWPKYHRIYFAGDIIAGSAPATTTMAYNDSNGKLSRAWIPEGAYPQGMNLNFKITSFTMLRNGTAIAWDDVTRRIFNCSDPVNNKWQEPIPSGTQLPTGRRFFLSHYVDNVLAISDSTDIYWSDNNGASWNQYTGIPAGTRILSACAPNDKSIVVGTEGRGVYIIKPGETKFRPANSGLPADAVITGLAGKYDYFKNDKSVTVVYAATTSGLFKSYDDGENWARARNEADITTIH